MPITVIASYNATLLQVAVSMLGMKAESGSSEDLGLNDTETKQLWSQDSLPFCDEPTVGSEESSARFEGSQDIMPIVSDDSCSVLPKTEISADTVMTSATPDVADFSLEDLLPVSIPKIHINGKGENSGAKKWKTVLKQIQHV